jgi:cytochrome c oxidase subunit 2
VDGLFWFMVLLCGVVAAGVVCAVVYFSIRYRRGSGADRTGGASDSLPVELAWMGIPSALFLAVFIWSLFLFVRMRTPPADAQTIYIVAKQWMWKAQHAGGQREINALHVPLGIPIRLTMTSEDVIHSFYVPAFRVKQDVLPGRYTQLWFTATRPGHYSLFCAEYCGLDHSRMGGEIEVMRPAQFAHWLEGHPGPATLAAQGAGVFRAHGCGGCHGSAAVVHAPDLTGLYGRVVHLADGTQVIADERYIRDAILLPGREVVAGFANVMPSFAGQLSEEEVLALIAYLKADALESADEHD